MTEETVQFTMQAGIARLTLNRPDRLNAFSDQMHDEFNAALRACAEADGLRCVLITGNGRGFCSGQDLSFRSAEELKTMDLGEKLENGFNQHLRVMKSIQAPLVCGVNGVAAGAGANIALNCDLVLAARSAKFIQAFTNIGLIPDCNGTWLLPRLVGMARAKSLAMLGRPLSAETAAEWGLIHAVADDESFAETLQALVDEVAARPTRALLQTRDLMETAWQHSRDEHLDHERDAQRVCGLSHDYNEGVQAFMQKRKPNFKGH